MKILNFKKWGLSLILACMPTLGSAAHIDALGIDVSLYSSDGAGNFVLQYDEYFGSDGWMWGGSTWLDSSGGYMTGSYQSGGIANNLTITGATVSTTTPGADITFSGLVDALGNETAGFGSGQVNTQYVYDDTEAALYSGLVGYNIFGYDPLLSYTINVIANDCCYVNLSGGPSFNGSLTFDPSVVINPNIVPAPATLALMGLGLVGMGFRARRTQK